MKLFHELWSKMFFDKRKVLTVYDTVMAGYTLWGTFGVNGSGELCEHSADTHH